MKIRIATVEDISAIQRLYRELDRYHADLLPEIIRPLSEDGRPDSVIREWIENTDAEYLVAENGSEIIGFINVRKSAPPGYPMFKPREFAMIENAIVKNERRGSGIGRQLFNAAVNWALERGLEHIQITVWSANSTAREFYIRQGFKPLTEKMELDLRKRKADG